MKKKINIKNVLIGVGICVLGIFGYKVKVSHNGTPIPSIKDTLCKTCPDSLNFKKDSTIK